MGEAGRVLDPVRLVADHPLKSLGQGRRVLHPGGHLVV